MAIILHKLTQGYIWSQKSTTSRFSTLLWQILLRTKQWLEVFNTCAPLTFILHMLLISCLNSCIDLPLIIGILSSACFAIFLVHLIMVLPCTVIYLYLFMPSLMLTGLIIRMTTPHPPVLILFTLVAIRYSDHLRNNAWLNAPPLKLNTVLSPLQLLSYIRFVIF